ncbi:MAG: PilC/PilY family type IV pilus protein [Desulfobacterales bacterium]|jgi:type IV pilus assembly protein PilY1
MLKAKYMNIHLKRIRSTRHRRLAAISRFCGVIAALLIFGAQTVNADIELADAPLLTKVNPPPTNLMILMDDSGSMTYEILVKGNYEGQFPNPNSTITKGYCYVFDDMGDNYNYSDEYRYLGEEGRQYWRSQWHVVNALYYNPNAVYEPWPAYTGKDFLPANTENPLVHPLRSKTLDLDKRAFKVGKVTIPWAHYFVQSTDGRYFLVILDGDEKVNKYYTFTTDGGSEPLDKIKTLTLVPDPPSDIDRDYGPDRQNFANWFTYHRRREFVAKAAIARVKTDPDLTDIRIGLLGINNKVIVPLRPVRAVINGEFKDETDVLVEHLYAYVSRGGTPLKQGLERVGEYYQTNDGSLEGVKGDPPYPAEGGACQQSFTLVVTDGYYSDQGHTFQGNTDGSGSDPYGEWGGGSEPFSDNFNNTLADTALYFYAQDLLPKFDNLIPTNKWDRAAHQHMVTFAVAFGVTGTLNPEDYEGDRSSPDYLKTIIKNDEPREYGDYVVWPEVTGNRKPESIDDLWHATVNGRGVFVHAGEPKKLVEGLQQIIKDIKGRQPTSVASVSVNGDRMFGKIGPDVFIYQSSYSYIDYLWFGDVKAYRTNPVTGEIIEDPIEWSAAARLQSKPWQTRQILTFDGETSGQLFEFKYLTDDQKEKLGSDAENTVNFLRGQEPGSSGNRINMLGDIVHSPPTFFDEVVYFGANDGMLHAHEAKTGDELFAYVPYLVFDHLKDLADPDYGHRFYVDSTPTVQKSKNLLYPGGEQTLLVSGLGAGGQGYFALDVSRPDNMSQDDVLWEFPNRDTSGDHRDDMGYSFSKPVVVKSYSKSYPWIVIFGNGYNSPNQNSVLFILDAASGSLIRKIEAGIGPDNGLSSPIAVDIDFDDVVDFVYAGDLKGNLWKFDLLSENPAQWAAAFKSGDQAVALFSAADPFGNPQPITTRPDVMFHPEKPGLMVCFGTGKMLATSDLVDAQIQTLYGIWDYGDTIFQAPDNWSPDDDDEFVGTFVSRSLNPDVRKLSSAYLSEKVKLLKQTATDFDVNSNAGNITVRILTANQPLWETRSDPDGGGQLPDPSASDVNDVGWYLDLDVYAGERIISDLILRDGILIAIGFIPSQADCASGGDSVFMELNAFTGGTIGSIQFDLHEDGIVDEDDLVEVEINGKLTKLPASGKKLAGLVQSPAIIQLNETIEKKYLSSSAGGIVEIAEKTAKTGIAYWLEIR